MKKAFILMIALIAGAVNAASEFAPLELWNKTSQPLYFAIASTDKPTDDKVLSEPLTQLPAGKWVTADSDIVKLNKSTRILITQDPKMQSVRVYTFPPTNSKHIWVRVKQDGSKLIFGPQTGPLLGFLGSLERGLPKDQNIDTSNYSEQTLTRSKWQQAKALAKRAFYRYKIGG